MTNLPVGAHMANGMNQAWPPHPQYNQALMANLPVGAHMANGMNQAWPPQYSQV
eukprot:CAMPEP_0185591946 /NCGR_PEP_ID=MMETSP0434-20130131/66331_1 /TAXON_ID=626734 ORGANISM="Favella taraikaensis, Strain Fe Narragansett Bay" /NCGR_SAMPLE_ID=MMETSP0434 /ASSEMBLY_ACC=CAM_ASM_000379 /LENGTH=53 /DNA_ID=CAMNT_0028217383 /DNA_START=581 /DNA_END=745 /DNA_ORIENTATION=-